MRKNELERALQSIPPHRNPRPSLEQYCTPAPIAADVLWTAMAFGDIEGRRVVDLGCGTGVFAIGAALMGAASVKGVDIDSQAVADATEAASRMGIDAEFMTGDVKEVQWEADTVIMNPPFGAQRRRADRPFLEAAVRLAPVVYSLHNASTTPFLERMVASLGRRIAFQKSYKFQIPHLFEFHEKKKKDIDVVLLRIC